MKHDEIVEEIGRLSETTLQLKAKLDKPKSKMDNFKEYAGVVSLLLSLVTGFFALFTSFVSEPEKTKTETRSKLHDTLAQLVSVNQEYMREIQQGDPNANNGALDTKRNILLQQAEDLASGNGVASAEDQLNLGNEYEFARKPELALKHFNTAMQLAGKDVLMKASAETRIGRLDFYGISGSTQKEGRQHFDEAEHLLRNPTTMQDGVALVQSLYIRSWVECAIGDPALGVQARARAQIDLTILARDPAVSPQLIDAYKVSFTNGFTTTHCAVPIPTVILPSEAVPGGAAVQVPLPSNKLELSSQMMRLLVARNYAAFEANMTATAQAQLPESQLRSVWEKVLSMTGAYKETLTTRTKIVNNVTFYIVQGRCEKALVNLALAFDDVNRVSYILITPLSARPKSEIESRAAGVVADFFAQKFDKVFSQFGEGLKGQLPAERLQPLFAQVTNAVGHWDHVISETKDQDLDIVDVLCQLQGGKTNIRVAFDPDMRINTFFISPAK